MVVVVVVVIAVVVVIVIIRLKARLQPSIGFTFESDVTVFTHWDLTLPKAKPGAL